MENNTKMNQHYKIPKQEIDNMVSIANFAIRLHEETPMSEKSIELRAILYTLNLIVKNSTLENE